MLSYISLILGLLNVVGENHIALQMIANINIYYPLCLQCYSKTLLILREQVMLEFLLLFSS